MKVVVAGAGAAGLEALAALAQFAGAGVELALLAPDRAFGYQPVSTARQFALAPRREWPLDELAAEIGAERVRDALAFVEEGNELVTRDGDRLRFDALVVASGARQRSPLRDAIPWSPDERQLPAFAALLHDLASGAAERAAFVVPEGAGWPLSAYELALVAATAGRAQGRDPEILVATAEAEALEALGEQPRRIVAKRLAEAEVEVLARAHVEDPEPPETPMADPLAAVIGRINRRREATGPQLRVDGERRPFRFDRVVALPAVEGEYLSGLPHDPDGFLPVDEHARVVGAERVWAAGDVTSTRLKHSLVATAQADAAARAIAALAGAPVEPEPWEPVLHGILVDRPIAPPASVWVHEDEPLTHCLWWPPGRVTGRFLAERVAAKDRSARAGLRAHPGGVPVSATVGAVPGVVSAAAHAEGVGGDVLVRELQALRRLERDSVRRAAAAGRELERFEADEGSVIERLEAAGYLRHET